MAQPFSASSVAVSIDSASPRRQETAAVLSVFSGVTDAAACMGNTGSITGAVIGSDRC
jgi:hypothetical protein